MPIIAHPAEHNNLGLETAYAPVAQHCIAKAHDRGNIETAVEGFKAVLTR